jgi:hypothetical protein
MKIMEVTEMEEGSISITDTTASPQDLVIIVVQALVEHYRQRIHVVPEEPPHFDSDGTCSPTIPPVIRHWVARMQQSNHSSKSLVEHLLTSYQTCIRPALFQRSKAAIDPSGVAVLVHYEILVSQYSSQTTTGEKQRQQQQEHRQSNSDDRNNGRRSITVEVSQSLLSQTLQRLACDVTLVTSSSDGVSPYMISNVILPTLLRLQSLILDVDGSDVVGSDVIRRCAVSLLAFGVPRLGPREVDAAIAEELSHISRYLVLSSAAAALKDDNTLDAIRLQGMDWKTVELDGTAWDDPNVGVATRVVNTLWCQLALHQQPASTSAIDTASDLNLNVSATKMAVLASLSMESMAKAVRAHFFGRDILEDAANTALTNKPTTRLHLGRTVSYSPPSNDPLTRPYQTIPSRVHVALQFISLMEIDTALVNLPILDELLPICYELLMASNDAIRALGAAALLHLLKCTATPTDLWSQVVASLLPPLDHACQTCRVGPAVAVIGLAQTHLFRQLAICSSSSFARDRRRQAAQHWLLVLHKNSVKMGDPLQWGLLMGTILPLLADHAAAENADAMELGRLGLTALLPLLHTEVLPALWQGDDDDDDDQARLLASLVRHEIPLLALVALSQLLVAAHPIMPRHGGKIASALLACMGHHHRQKQDASATDNHKEEDDVTTRSISDQCIVAVAQHVAAMALVVCGPRARAVLEQVVDSKEEYDEGFVRLIEQVQQQADTLNESCCLE